MRKVFLLCLIMLISVTTMAEGYSGKIISGNKLQGLADATIQLFNNNVFVGGCKSKTDGSFSVNTSQKATRISVSYVGLESYFRKDSLGLPENLGVIALSTHNVGLKEVTVTGTLKQETYNKDIYLITDSMRKGTASSGQLLAATAFDRNSHDNGAWSTINLETPENVIGEDNLSTSTSVYAALYAEAVG